MKMFRNVSVVLAVVLWSAVAWAQLQPTPMFWANGSEVALSRAQGIAPNWMGPHGYNCDYADLSAYDGVMVRMVTDNVGTCAVRVRFWAGIDTSISEVNCLDESLFPLGMGAMINNNVSSSVDSGFNPSATYTVSGINRKVTIMVQYTGVGCSGVRLYYTPMVYSGLNQVAGADSTGAAHPIVVDTSGRTVVVGAGASASAPVGNPVLIAGSDGAAVRTALTNVYGATVTTGFGGGLSLGAETLVGVAATAMPTDANAKSFTFFNAGTNAIYCGFDNTVTTANGLKIGGGQGVTFDMASVGLTPYCITTVQQIAGSGTRTVLSTGADSVRIYGGGGGGSSTSTDFAPAAPTSVACSANVSCAVTGLTAGACYQFSCNADFQYRVGTATPTAVTTDNEAKAGVMYRQCLSQTSSYTAFAFISGSAMTCKVGLVPSN